MNNVTLLGIDLAKDVFQLHGVNQHGKKVLGRKISREALPKFIAKTDESIYVLDRALSKVQFFNRLDHK